MNIPEKVKIGWRTYIVEQGEHRTADGGGDLYGEIVYEQNRIYLYAGQGEENKRVSLLHEIFHGIGYMIGNEEFRKNEGLITALSECFYQIIKDNPQMLVNNLDSEKKIAN